MMKTPGLKGLIAFCAIGITIVFSALTANAQNLQLASDSPDVYVVKEGDTLWDISAVFLVEPWRWPEIWQVNPGVTDPDLIYPGDVLNLVYMDGSPRIVLQRGNRTTVRLSPQVRETPLLSPIPAIPRQALAGFLSENRIVDKATFETAPYILASTTGNLLMGAGHEVYIRGDIEGSVNSYEIFRLGVAYVDRENDEVLGQEAVNLGAASIISSDENGIRKALIVSSQEELKAGDRLLPKEASSIDPRFFPRPPQTQLDGNVIGLLNKESRAAQFESLIINLGEQDGLAVGDLLAIYQAGEVVRDPLTNERVELPATEIGLMLTYRTFEKLSYGVILSLTQPSAVGNSVKNPQ
ncbi:MAG: LysM peptidoglycan-binding domain-containing protein [Gammaproteobacteria bacterium]|nr:LysM peptidoglycan-binding domain-containing protein [Gammaproteobacteria bacterium]MDP2139685.1 LysM peptidoglycan-binding domain-containing protein [Gammaproteobacteria bacterium]MDP2348889.1 LysM peptidoglycan-binding domain-containing protein [Gammaproteobacteria bacterium]